MRRFLILEAGTRNAGAHPRPGSSGSQKRSAGSALAAALLLIALAVMAAACGTATTTYPSSSLTTAASGVATSVSSSISSNPLPAPGSSILLAPTDAVVPQGKLLEVTTRASTPGEAEYFLLDTHSRRGYREMASPCPTPGYSIMIFDDTGHRTMDGVTLEVYPDPASGESRPPTPSIALAVYGIVAWLFGGLLLIPFGFLVLVAGVLRIARREVEAAPLDLPRGHVFLWQKGASMQTRRPPADVTMRRGQGRAGGLCERVAAAIKWEPDRVGLVPATPPGG